MKNEFHIKRLINGRGYGAAISLDASFQDGTGVDLHFENNIPSNWHPSISFGVHYFHEHFIRNRNNKLRVNVLDLSAHTVDSSHSLVAYVTIKCLSGMAHPDTDIVELNDHGEIILRH